MSPLKILLYGNSIWIESLASKLHQNKDWEVTCKNGEVVKDFGKVDLIIIDLGDITISEFLPKLSALPGVILIGVDAIANTVTVLTGRTRPLGTLHLVLETLKHAM